MKLNRAANTLIIGSIVIYGLIVGKNFLIPIILGVVIWYIINAIYDLIERINFFGKKIPESIGLILASLIIIGLIIGAGSLLSQNINNMIEAAPDYRVNLDQQISRIAKALGFSGEYRLESLSNELDLGSYLRKLLNSFRKITSQFFLVLLYTLFLLFEQNTFPRKFAALRMDKDKKQNILSILESTNSAVMTYLGVKFLTSFSTGLVSYLIILYSGLDFPLFWAFLIFILNFVPTVGSVVATLFPTLISLVQFETLHAFFIILIGVGITQVIIGGILEPRLFGQSLNISPLVVIISLIFWGIIWGVVGMVLCVPITVIAIIICSKFPKTRPIAVLLSRNGRLKE